MISSYCFHIYFNYIEHTTRFITSFGMNTVMRIAVSMTFDVLEFIQQLHNIHILNQVIIQSWPMSFIITSSL